ncbi:MAG: TIR domain-containing protein [Anaerolineales bacterium]|nr:TIR domain-containing protein [Anaerolineales bacterium]
MTNRPLRVFLCHSSADKPAVRELYQKLRAEPWIQPWLDEEELYPGQDWNMEIEKAVEAADAIIVCLSNNSITKEGYVQKEIKTALDYSDYKPEGTVFIIPVRLEDCKSPNRLSKWQYADYFESQREPAFQRLLVSLKKRADSLDLNKEEPESNRKKKIDGNKIDLSLRFSFYLDEMAKKESVDYSGERFLAKMKTQPPFLATEQSMLLPEHEKNLAEHFLAKEFIQTNREVLRGGGKYKIKPMQDSFEKIAIAEYGDEKYAINIKASNPGVITTSTGQYIYLPYIDISDSFGLSSEQIEKKFKVAEDKWIEPTLSLLVVQFNLMEDKALSLLKMVFIAAQKTLLERKRQFNTSESYKNSKATNRKKKTKSSAPPKNAKNTGNVQIIINGDVVNSNLITGDSNQSSVFEEKSPAASVADSIGIDGETEEIKGDNKSKSVDLFIAIQEALTKIQMPEKIIVSNQLEKELYSLKVAADEKLSDAFYWLIVNAIESMRDEGVLRLYTKEDVDNKLAIIIESSSPLGFPFSSDLIFDTSLKNSAYDSHGIGAVWASAFIRKFGGDVSLESQNGSVGGKLIIRVQKAN